MTVATIRSHFEVWTRKNGQLGATGQPAKTLRKGKEIAEKIAAAWIAGLATDSRRKRAGTNSRWDLHRRAADGLTVSH